MFKAKTYLTQNELDNLIKPALDYLLTLRYKSGNLPSSLCNDPDQLVQWCHGAAGVSHTYALAYKVRNLNLYICRLNIINIRYCVLMFYIFLILILQNFPNTLI